MGPDFEPDGPGPDTPHFHHMPGPPSFVLHWWSTAGSLLVVMAIIVGLWAVGYGLVLAHVVRSDKRRERTDLRATWNHAMARHHVVAEAFARFECDVQAVLATPALADVRQAPTARFVDAFAEAGALATQRYPAPEFARRFVEAVERAEQAWAAAVAAAARSRDARFSPEERSVLEQARRLLDVVESTSYDGERHTALRQVLRKLRDLERSTGWRLPDAAALALEERARGVLSA